MYLFVEDGEGKTVNWKGGWVLVLYRRDGAAMMGATRLLLHGNIIVLPKSYYSKGVENKIK